MVRLIIPKLGYRRFFLGCFSIILLLSCSSNPPEAMSEKAIDAYPEKPPASISVGDLISLKIKSVLVNVNDGNNCLSVELTATYPGMDNALPPTAIDYRVRLINHNTTIAFEKTAKLGQDGVLRIVKLPGIVCGETYSLQIFAGTESEAINVESPLQITDNFSAFTDPRTEAFSDTIPILYSAKLLAGGLSLPRGATNLKLELRDQDNVVIKGLPNKPLLNEQKPESVTAPTMRVNFQLTGDFTNNQTPINCFYKFDFPSGIVSDWHAGPRFLPAKTENWRHLIPGNNQYCLSAQTQFAWQPISEGGNYLVKFSLSEPQSTNSNDLQGASIECQTNHCLINLPTVLPNLNEGKPFYWQVIHKKTGISSEWQKINLVKILDDIIPVINPGQSVNFTMGTTTGPADSQPSHPVTLQSAFALAQTPVTNDLCVQLSNQLISRGFAYIKNSQLLDSYSNSVLIGLSTLDYGQQFGLIVSDGVMQVAKGRENHPAIGISWHGAQILCQQANFCQAITAAGWRLPSEAEWEYVATCGGQADSPWAAAIQAATGNFSRSRSPYEDLNPPYTRKGGPTVPVNYYAKNRQAIFKSQVQKGLLTPQSAVFSQFDILGNVWEWCGDWYDIAYYKTSTNPVLNPQGPEQISAETIKFLETLGQLPARVVRGGAWNTLKSDINPRFRGKFPPGQTSFSIGMRLAKSINP